MKEKCQLCQSENLKLFLKRKERNLVECQDCGLVFASPFPKKSEVEKLNRKESRKFFEDYLEEENQKRKQFKRAVLLIRKYISEGKLLDVGCALGFFLEEAKRVGFEVYGLDLLDFVVDYCHKKGLTKVFKGTLEDKKFSSSSFDVITAFHILEHYWQPGIFLGEARRILRPNGFLLVAVPNRRCIIARLLGRYWFGYHHPQHLFIFERKTLVNYLTRNGFQALEWREEKGVEFFLTRTSQERFEYYYKNPVLLKLVRFGKSMLDFLRIDRIPMLTGHIWVVAKKIPE